MEGQAKVERKFAQKVSISELSRMEIEEGLKIHVIGTLINSEQMQAWTRFIVDDGTASFEFRHFNDSEGISVGDFVRIIGRLREYEGTRYVAVDLIKKLDSPLWISHWKLERELKGIEVPPVERIISIIRKLDDGPGAEVQQVIDESLIDNADEIIERLKSLGEIFETKPGRIKILE